jgi:hypothetical protein
VTRDDAPTKTPIETWLMELLSAVADGTPEKARGVENLGRLRTYLMSEEIVTGASMARRFVESHASETARWERVPTHLEEYEVWLPLGGNLGGWNHLLVHVERVRDDLFSIVSFELAGVSGGCGGR